MNTESGVNDIDGPCTQSREIRFSCLTCSVDFKTKDDLTTHIAACNEQGLWTSHVLNCLLLFKHGLSSSNQISYS